MEISKSKNEWIIYGLWVWISSKWWVEAPIIYIIWGHRETSDNGRSYKNGSSTMGTVLYIFPQDWKNLMFLYRTEIWRIVEIVVYWTASYYLWLFLLHYLSLERGNKCKIYHQNSPFIFTLLIPDFSINVMHYAMWIFNRAEHRL